MGRVLSWEDVVRGRMPTPDDFTFVIDMLRTEFPDVKGVVSALLIGSAMLGGHNVRSDVDCVVVYEGDCFAEVVTVLRELRHRALFRHVPVEFILVDASIAKTSMHGISPGFFRHFNHAVERGGLIGLDPRELFFLKGSSERRGARSYVAHKLRRFQKAAVNDDALTAAGRRHAQKVLELATHLARKVLLVEQADMPIDDKKTVLRLYREVATPQELKCFHQLVDADNYYTTSLTGDFRGEIGKEEYEQMLIKLFGLTPTAVRWLQLTARRIG